MKLTLSSALQVPRLSRNIRLQSKLTGLFLPETLVLSRSSDFACACAYQSRASVKISGLPCCCSIDGRKGVSPAVTPASQIKTVSKHFRFQRIFPTSPCIKTRGGLPGIGDEVKPGPGILRGSKHKGLSLPVVVVFRLELALRLPQKVAHRALGVGADLSL